MKRLAVWVVGLALLLAVGCRQRLDVAAETAAVKGVLDGYIAAVEKEDMGLYGTVVAGDPAMVNFGTDGPPIVGWDALKKVMEDQNVALSDTKVIASDVSVRLSPAGDWALATSLWKFRSVMAGKALALPVRCTWVLEKQGGRWVIVHFHKSVPTA